MSYDATRDFAPEGEFWFCMRHHRVERFDEGCDSADRIGPFPTRDAAAHALQTIAEREKLYDKEDSD